MSEETTKPASTFQTFNPHEGILTVHATEDPNSDVVFHGKPEDYSGFATEPAAPTTEYNEKQARLAAERGEEVPNGSEAISETGSSESTPIHGKASDGTVFTAESDAVIAYRQQYPDVTLEAAIGSVVGIYEQQIAQ